MEENELHQQNLKFLKSGNIKSNKQACLKIYGLAVSGELRDFDIWSLRERQTNGKGGVGSGASDPQYEDAEKSYDKDEGEGQVDIYSSLLIALRNVWNRLHPSACSLAGERLDNIDLEKGLWRIWWKILPMPEFDIAVAINRIFRQGEGDFVDVFFRRVLQGSADLDYACFIHWL